MRMEENKSQIGHTFDVVKITSAVYKILDGLPESDPLKNKAKEKALLVMENLDLADIEILENYLAIGKNQGWIDSMNFLIITKEYGLIKSSIQKKIPMQSLQLVQSGNVEDFLTDRQKNILKILAKQEKIQVQDVIKEIPNITKRTVRRDLDDLLKKRKIVRIGEFNQAFYQIAR